LRDADAAKRLFRKSLIRIGQAKWVGGSDLLGQIQLINRLFEVTA
jgi:hypothetical protein